MALPPLANAELSIMKLLWQGDRLTARHIREELYPYATKTQHGTVQKLLQRLEEKGFISRDEEISRGITLTDTARAHAIPQAVVHVPLLGRIVAGEPHPVPGSDFSLMGDETIELTRDILGDPAGLYALQVQGNSMIDALVNDGDVVIMRHQQKVENGEMAAVWLKEREEVTLKRFYDEGAQVRLQPANPSMGPIYVDPHQVEIQGKVVMVVRQL